jgi:hypothetical protein
VRLICKDYLYAFVLSLNIVFFLPLYIGKFSIDKLFFSALLILGLTIYYLTKREIPFPKKFLFFILITLLFLSINGIGYEPFENFSLTTALILTLLSPQVNLKALGKFLFIELSLINFLQIIFSGLNKKLLIYPTGNANYTALLLLVSFLLSDFSSNKSKKKQFLGEIFLLIQLLFLQSRTLLTIYFIFKLQLVIHFSFKKFIALWIILNLLLAALLIFNPAFFLQHLNWNYRFYIWSLFEKDFKNPFLTGINLFKYQSYPLQSELLKKDFNLVYDINQIETLHNDYLQILFDFKLWGFLFFLWLFFQILKSKEEEARRLFPFFLTASFHNIIYAYPIFFILLLNIKNKKGEKEKLSLQKPVFLYLYSLSFFIFSLLIIIISISLFSTNLYLYHPQKKCYHK